MAARTPFWVQGLAMAALKFYLFKRWQAAAPLPLSRWQFPDFPNPPPASLVGTRRRCQAGFPLQDGARHSGAGGCAAGLASLRGSRQGPGPQHLRGDVPAALASSASCSSQSAHQLKLTETAAGLDRSLWTTAASLDPFLRASWKLEQEELAQARSAGQTGWRGRDSALWGLADDRRPDHGRRTLGCKHRFGDAGRGYTLIAKPWAWYGHRGVEITATTAGRCAPA